MSIWGVGYGSIPLRVRNYSVIFENGELNTETYGNLLPSYGWSIQNNNLVIKENTTVYFEEPCNAQFNKIIYSTIAHTSAKAMRLRLGSTLNGTEYYDQIMPIGVTDYVVELLNIPTPFYISIRVLDVGSTLSYRDISKFVLE